jgi:hypothetical protein
MASLVDEKRSFEKQRRALDEEISEFQVKMSRGGPSTWKSPSFRSKYGRNDNLRVIGHTVQYRIELISLPGAGSA